jgi:hypothetical protein
MRALLWANVVETKLHQLESALKANFDPNQPRVPAGNPDGGQWTRVGVSSAAAGSQLAQNVPRGRGSGQVRLRSGQFVEATPLRKRD